MGDYEKVTRNIEEFKKRNDVVETDEVISVFDLYNVLIDNFNKLRNIDNGNVLRKKINKDNNAFIKKIRNIARVKTLLNFECDNILLTADENKFEISFYFGDTKVILCKNKGESNIYYSLLSRKDDILVNKYYNDIMNIFNILEEYHELFMDNKDKLDIEKIYDMFKFSILCFKDGSVLSNISLNKNDVEEKQSIYGVSIKTIIGLSKYQLLRKIPLQKSDLALLFQKILNEREQNNVKRLIRKQKV